MFGLVGAGAVVSGKRLGRYPLFGITIVAIFILGRVILVLPFCLQPRLELDSWHFIVGGIASFVGLIFCTPGLTIKPFTAPDNKMKLRTSGFYGIVRNPIYFGELLWCLGWAIIFRSIIGIALVPLWWAGLLILVVIEEESMERELGKSYLEYKKKVRGRIVPGLPL
jgi:protein-S-isoprenylcysteine O-methyltransferase Ste14